MKKGNMSQLLAFHGPEMIPFWLFQWPVISRSFCGVFRGLKWQYVGIFRGLKRHLIDLTSSNVVIFVGALKPPAWKILGHFGLSLTPSSFAISNIILPKMGGGAKFLSNPIAVLDVFKHHVTMSGEEEGGAEQRYWHY